MVDRQRVFGWELTVFGALAPALESCNELQAHGNYEPSAATHEREEELDRAIVKAHPLLWELANPPELFNGQNISWQYREYSKRRLTGAIPRNLAVETQYEVMVRNYRWR
ncbi:hypothetical protein BK665_04000 [Pseudomonas frederiksbergensis]|uniref:Uncharacterized protein n=1 Tax=Pseudomonas frederiksbergensis TaxID=104087 RepID=A0A423KQ24_9PSED|nr:hypothetical protein BK665_04000 [Pseudomonas frederiksbergensis]